MEFALKGPLAASTGKRVATRQQVLAWHRDCITDAGGGGDGPGLRLLDNKTGATREVLAVATEQVVL